MKLQNKVAIVSGASSGMGRAISKLFAREGAIVYAVARSKDKLLALKEECKDYKGEIRIVSADLMDKETVKNLVDNIYEESKKLDILVNNAGIMDDFSPIAEVTDEMYDRVFTLNVKAPLYLMRSATKLFLDNGGGNIINISSLGGLYGARAGAVYTASKHALVGLSKNTAFMYAKDNIRTNAICPGGVDTDISSGEFMKNVNQFGIEKAMSGTAGNPRTGSPDEIANIALFLASDDSSFVNGTTIAADGGWSAY